MKIKGFGKINNIYSGSSPHRQEAEMVSATGARQLQESFLWAENSNGVLSKWLSLGLSVTSVRSKSYNCAWYYQKNVLVNLISQRENSASFSVCG